MKAFLVLNDFLAVKFGILLVGDAGLNIPDRIFLGPEFEVFGQFKAQCCERAGLVCAFNDIALHRGEKTLFVSRERARALRNIE